jgi:hypothetical protein
MKHRQENGSFHIKLEPSLRKKISDHLLDTQLFPKPLEDQNWPDLPSRSRYIASARENKKNFFGEP